MQDNILAKLTSELIMKFIGEPDQDNINTLEQKLAEKAAKIKTTEDVVEKGCKDEFLVAVSGKNKHGIVIGNPEV